MGASFSCIKKPDVDASIAAEQLALKAAAALQPVLAPAHPENNGESYDEHRNPCPKPASSFKKPPERLRAKLSFDYIDSKRALWDTREQEVARSAAGLAYRCALTGPPPFGNEQQRLAAVTALGVCSKRIDELQALVEATARLFDASFAAIAVSD